MPRFTMLIAIMLTFVGCNDASNIGPTPSGMATCRIEPTPRIVSGASPTVMPQSFQPLETNPDSLYFERIRGAFLLPDGFTIVDSQARQVFFFDNSGRLQNVVGREGEGPGEFRNMLPAVYDDTLWILDTRLRRWTVLTAAGQIQRSIPAQAQREGSLILNPIGPFPDGTVLFAQASGSQSRGPETYRDTVTLERFAIDGEFLGQLGPFPSTERFIDATVVFEVHTRPFGKIGSFLRLGADVLIATGDSALLRLYRTDGTLLRTITVQGRSFTISEDVAQAFRAQVVADQSWTERALENVEIPAKAPPYGAVLVTRDQQVWVADVEAPGDTLRRYTNYTITGQLTEELVIPIPFRISDADQNRVLMVYTDSLGSQSAVLFDRECTS